MGLVAVDRQAARHLRSPVLPSLPTRVPQAGGNCVDGYYRKPSKSCQTSVKETKTVEKTGRKLSARPYFVCFVPVEVTLLYQLSRSWGESRDARTTPSQKVRPQVFLNKLAVMHFFLLLENFPKPPRSGISQQYSYILSPSSASNAASS